MRGKHWPNSLGVLAGQKRAASIVEETGLARAKADLMELSEILAVLDGMKSRLLRLRARHSTELAICSLAQLASALITCKHEALSKHDI